MPGRHAQLRRGRRRSVIAPAAAFAAVTVSVVGAAFLAGAHPLRSPAGDPASAVLPAPTAGRGADGTARATDGPGPTVRPERVAIPAIGVDAPVTVLGLAADGAVEVPADPDEAGWVEVTPVPGGTGPAVLAGHVDSRTGPAVFYRLPELTPGAQIAVSLDDGSDLLFDVASVERYPKDDFPTARVYGPAPTPQLRLITCGGSFDRAAGSYSDNVVVTAYLS